MNDANKDLSNEYYDDNSFDENGVGFANEEDNNNFPTNNGSNLIHTGGGLIDGFRAGYNAGKNATGNNPALGQKKENGMPPKSNDKLDNKDKDRNNKNDLSKNNSNKDLMDDNKELGKKNNTPINNPLPGGNTLNKDNNSDDKKKIELKKPLDKKPLGSKEDEGFNPRKIGDTLNPMNIANSIKSKLGLGKQDDNKDKKDDNPVAGILKNAIASMPITVKIAVASSVLLLFGLFLLLYIIFGGLTPALVSMCEDGNSSSNVSFNGTEDQKEFMCSMQDPLASQSLYTITSHCGYNVDSTHGGRWHNGIDLGTFGNANSPIYAVQGGKVIETHDGCSAGYSDCGGNMGNHVIIDHGGIRTIYMHMLKGSVKVNEGDIVGKGQHIGNVGNTGHSYGEHLHFEMRVNSTNEIITAVNDYFDDRKAFIKSCGSSWDGENAGDSANIENVVNSSSTYTSVSTSNNCCVAGSSSSSSTGTGNYCASGITVEGSGTYDLDDYIAGVISAENSYEKDGKIEASKANAIAARTYALYHTKDCTKSIGNSSNSQNFKSPGSIGKRAASETSGQVMLYNGELFSSEYDAFCINDGDCPDSSCSGDSCSVSYLKKPSQEKHKITLRKGSSLYESVISGAYNDAGHARGMSQLVARQMQDEGKTYDEILKFFYADGVEITGVSSGNSCDISGDGFTSVIWQYYQTDYTEPYGSYGTIATHGCGPTSMAIVVSSLLNKAHDPVELTKFACSNNYCSASGTSWSYFEAAGKKYGLKVKTIEKSDSGEVLTSLNRGDSLVIALMNKGTFTTGGHFIVLISTDGDKVAIQDPASRERSKNTYSFKNVILKEATKFWVISK